MNESATCIQAIAAIAQVFIAVATIALTVVLYLNSKRDARVTYTRAIHESWNQLNSLVLANPDLIPLANAMFGVKGDAASKEAAQKRYIALLTLNILQATYLGRGVRLVDDAYQLKGTYQVLDPLLHDKDVQDVLHWSGYHPDFVDFCDRREVALGISRVTKPNSEGSGGAPVDSK